MPEPPRRARFQIHLSTAIVLMFVAGGLIWANVRECVETRNVYDSLGVHPAIKFYSHGWPLPITYTVEGERRWRINHYVRSYGRFHLELYVAIPVDLLTAIGISYSTWFLCEWLIRRRAARKGA